MSLLALTGPIKTVFGEIQGEMDIQEMDRVLLIGENGAGKSTLVQALKSHCTDQKIKASFLDQYPLKAINDLKVSTLIKQLKSEFQLEDVENFLKKFELESVLTKSINQLSGGENQILKLSICLSFDSQLYVLDEPFTFLDSQKRTQLISIIKELKAACIIIDHGKNEELLEPSGTFKLSRLENLAKLERVQ